VKRLALLLVLLPLVSIADERSGDDLTNISKNTATATAGDLVGGDTTTVALSPSNLGDVDISGCLASTQYSVFILWARQKIEIDPLCVADEYDAAGKHNLAAQLRCGVPLIRDLDYTGSTCIAENTFSLPDPCPGCEGTQAPSLEESFDRDEEEEYEHAQYAAQLAAITARLDAEEEQRRRNVRRYEAEQELIQQADQADAEYNRDFLEKFREIAQQVEQPAQAEEPPENDN